MPDRDAGRPEHRPHQLARDYARINEYGFLETPYRRVAGGKVAEKIDHLSAIEEGKYVIAQASATLDKEGRLVDELVSARVNGDLVDPDLGRAIQYMDVAPTQIVSVPPRWCRSRATTTTPTAR